LLTGLAIAVADATTDGQAADAPRIRSLPALPIIIRRSNGRRGNLRYLDPAIDSVGVVRIYPRAETWIFKQPLAFRFRKIALFLRGQAAAHLESELGRHANMLGKRIESRLMDLFFALIHLLRDCTSIKRHRWNGAGLSAASHLAIGGALLPLGNVATKCGLHEILICVELGKLRRGGFPRQGWP
jgi:hypothetical protein